MRNIKNTIAAITLMAIIGFSTTFSNASILVSDLTSETPAPCTESPIKEEKPDWGIIISDLVGGIVVTGLTGIVVTGVADTPVDCGIVVTG